MADFKTYMSLTDNESVSEITAILTKHHIPYKVEDTSKNFDASFSMNKADKSIMVFLNPADFEKATAVIDSELVLDESQINQDHFLYSFSNEELLDVIKTSEEWHPMDVKLSKVILRDRDFNLSEDQLSYLKTERAKELRQPDKNDITLIITGYIFALLGGFVGFFIGLHLINYKKTLPNGEKVWCYSEQDRKHGRNMLLIASLSVCLILFLLLNKYGL
ncbi:MAG: hypothetical protein QM710_03235 [Flavobacterium sp.]